MFSSQETLFQFFCLCEQAELEFDFCCFFFSGSNNIITKITAMHMKHKYSPLGSPPQRARNKKKKRKSGEKRFIAFGGAIVVAASAE